MIKAVYIPEQIIAIEGIDDSGNKLTLEYDKKSGVLTKAVGSGILPEKTKDFDLFLKLFFFSFDHTSPETLTKASTKISELLKTKGIDTTLSCISAQSEQSAIYSVGKDKRYSNSNELAVYKDSFLPSYLKIEEDTVIFSEYHKSVLPASFPGKIEFYKENKLIKTWLFYRKEHK